MYVCMHVYIYIYIYICVYTCVCTYIYIYIYITRIIHQAYIARVGRTRGLLRGHFLRSCADVVPPPACSYFVHPILCLVLSLSLSFSKSPTYCPTLASCLAVELVCWLAGFNAGQCLRQITISHPISVATRRSLSRPARASRGSSVRVGPSDM